MLAAVMSTLSSCAHEPLGRTGTLTFRVPVGQSCNISYSDHVAARLHFLPEGVTGRITQDKIRIILAASETATIGSTQISPAYLVEVVAPVSGVPVQTDESPCERHDEPI